MHSAAALASPGLAWPGDWTYAATATDGVQGRCRLPPI
jgi:hypothetical protein